MSENKDRDIPRSNEFPQGAVLIRNFEEVPQVHIFWGPGQLSTNHPNYTPPTRDEWHKKELLSIPKVVRFIYATQTAYDSDQFPDSGDPPVLDYIWRVESSERMDPPNQHILIVRWKLYENDAPTMITFNQSVNYSGQSILGNPYPDGIGFRFIVPYAFPVIAFLDFVDNGSFPPTYTPSGNYALTHQGNGSLLPVTPV